MTSQRKSQTHKVNRRAVAPRPECWNGPRSSHPEGLGMRSMYVRSYQSHPLGIFEASKELATSFLQQAREAVIEYHKLKNPGAFHDDVLHLAVSYDGTWLKIGHTFGLGCEAVIDWALDWSLTFTSCHCTVSTTDQKLKSRSQVMYEGWYQHHEDKGRCTQNYKGISGGMEVKGGGALVKWKRSQGHGMCCTTLFGDGDTKTFLALTRDQPYGDITIQKEECVNHVAKSLRTFLRNLKSSLAKKSIRIGGNTKGSLTDSNTSVEDMLSRVLSVELV